MSYDLYCYRSKSGKPDNDEADEIIGADSDKWAKKDRDPVRKLAIVKALKAYNQRLDASDFHYGDVAQLTPDIIEKEQKRFNHIEINHPEDEPSLTLTVYDNHVFLTVPYWYQGEKAAQLFEYMRAYINIIRQTAGYFVSDPQTGEVFDPAEVGFDGLAKYLKTGELNKHM